VKRLRVGRGESDQILSAARAIDEELQRSEAARVLAETERDKAIYELERLFHFIPALLIFKDLEGNLLRVNENTARGFGLVPSDMVGHHQREFWPEDQCAQFNADDQEIVRTGEGRHGYLEDVVWGGTTYTFRTWKLPIYNGAPKPIGIMLFAINLARVGDLSVPELGEEK
jgi:PAS domain S-box-containing protein